MKLGPGISAVITGGASGLGAASARELAGEGVKVALLDLNAENGEALASELGGVFCQCDVTDEASLDAAFEKARAVQGQERILFNCAGIAPPMKTLSKGRPHSLDGFEKVIKINLIGTFASIVKSATGMATVDPVTEDGERGVIINTASVAAFEGQIGQAAYAASKGGVVGLTLPVARDLADLGIRVCTIAPGLFDTPLLAALPEEARKSLGQQVPFPQRLGTPGEYAQLARGLIENPMMNGTVVRLDGAIRMGPR